MIPAEELFDPERSPPKSPAKGLFTLGPRTAKDDRPRRLDEVFQVSGGVLVDQRGRAVYYASHINPTFFDFVRRYQLHTPQGYHKAALSQDFTVGSLMLKSSWWILPEGQDRASFFVREKARVARLACKRGPAPCTDIKIDKIDQDKQEVVDVALVGLHVVGRTLHHREFIWATFEHYLNAPDWNEVESNPDKVDDFTFYSSRTQAKCNNAGIVRLVDESTQKLEPPTNVCRRFPWGSDAENARRPVIELNKSVLNGLAKSTTPWKPYWQNYRLVGTVWFKDPTNLRPGLTGQPILSMTTGSTRLANTTLETFRQDTGNCFVCHDTGPVKVKEEDKEKEVMPAKILNLSHLLRDGIVQRTEKALPPK
jgi:hypothetical protein